MFPYTLIPYRPIPSITTFHTDNLSFSLGDYGSLGFIGDRTIGNTGNESFDGLGFLIKILGRYFILEELLPIQVIKFLKVLHLNLILSQANASKTTQSEHQCCLQTV